MTAEIKTLTPAAEPVGFMAQTDIMETAGALERAVKIRDECLENEADAARVLREARSELTEAEQALVAAKAAHMNAVEGISG